MFPVFVERLSQKDAVIVQALNEKLQLFADMAESVAGLEDTASRSRLLLRGDSSDLQQGETLLKGAITEGRMTLHIMWICSFATADTWDTNFVSIMFMYCCRNIVINK